MVYFLVAFPALVMVEMLYMMRFTFVSDHWQYLGGMSVIALAVAGVATALDRLRQRSQRYGAVVGAVGLGTLGLLTWRQGRIYHDPASLWRDTLRKNPDSWIAHNNLGTFLSGKGKLSEAIELYQQAQRLKPDEPEVYYNWGNALVRQNKIPEAIAKFEQALRLQPNAVRARTNLGNALMRQGQVTEAIPQYNQALQVNPQDARTRNSLGLALFQIGRVPEAIAQFEQALRIEPDNFEARSNLAYVLAQQGDASEAIVQYKTALQGTPDWPPALRGLAWTLATHPDSRLRNGAEAVRLATRLCELTGYQQADALDVLAAAYAETGRFADAVRTAQDGVALAKTAGQADLAGHLMERLKLYQASQPFREGAAPSR